MQPVATGGRTYEFQRVPLEFEENNYCSPFIHKNNKSVGATTQHPKYQKLKSDVAMKYSEWADKPLGEFLAFLKLAGDPFYRRFLNKHGDGEYCAFRIADPAVLSKRGIYAYRVKCEIKYIGRCKDSMKKRINQGYGKIHPKNCYLDGQTTNCHLNALIAQSRDSIELWFCEIALAEIDNAEKELIRACLPAWNIQR